MRRTLNDLLIQETAKLIPGIGEKIIYTKGGGSPVLVNAVVERDTEARIPEAQFGLNYRTSILVSTIEVPKINRDADTFTFSNPLGDSPKTWQVRQIIKQDVDFWQIEVS